MSDSKEKSKQDQNQQRVIDLNVNGHLMSLGEGLYCIYHAPGQSPADTFGFPGLRISLPPFKQSAQVSIETFENDGWLGAEKSAALIRISGGSGLILVTVYQNPSSQHPAPKLQVVRLNDAPELISVDNQQVPAVGVQPQPTAQQQAPVKQTVEKSENNITMFAHVQGTGDVVVKSGEWVGNPDSKTWIEGFGLNIKKYIQPSDIEYQAVLGKGWMSPWYKGDQFCGSRGMALPLCGLRIKLSEEAAKKYHIRLSATFVDGTKLGPVEDDSILSAESVAPLEAIRFELISIADGKVISSGEANKVGKEAITPPKKAIRKIVPAKPARSNIKLKTTAAKAAAAKVAEQKATTKKNK